MYSFFTKSYKVPHYIQIVTIKGHNIIYPQTHYFRSQTCQKKKKKDTANLFLIKLKEPT